MAAQVYHISSLLDALVEAIDNARTNAANDRRWTTAINVGADWLLQQERVTFDAERHELTVNSPSGKTYHSNGACQCDAYAQHNACWHRAAARLVRRALELLALEAATVPAVVAPSLHEVERLADELHTVKGGAWIEARQEAAAELPALLTFAAEYDAAARAARIERAARVAAELFA